MKLGNYKWEICSKCGIRYVYIPGKLNHKCKTNWFHKIIIKFIDKCIKY